MSLITRMPAIFYGHGSPMNALDDNAYTRIWQSFAERFARPKAILAISAHWTALGTAVTAMTAPKTIHDFGGFPKPLFDVRIPHPATLRWPPAWRKYWHRYRSRWTRNGDWITAPGRW